MTPENDAQEPVLSDEKTAIDEIYKEYLGEVSVVKQEQKETLDSFLEEVKAKKIVDLKKDISQL